MTHALTLDFVLANEICRRMEISFSCVASKGPPMPSKRLRKLSSMLWHKATLFASRVRRYGECFSLDSSVFCAWLMAFAVSSSVDLILSRSLAE